MRIDEYVDRFGLSGTDMDGRILEYGCVSETVHVSQKLVRCAPAIDASLPFADFTFDLAICPCGFFVDTKRQDVDVHLRQIRELARVAKEVRIFPLTHQGVISPLLGPVLLGLQRENYGVEVRDVTTDQHPDGSAMLRVWALECQVG